MCLASVSACVASGFQPGHRYADGHGRPPVHGASSRPHVIAKAERTLELVEELRSVVPIYDPADEFVIQALGVLLVRIERAEAALTSVEAEADASGRGSCRHLPGRWCVWIDNLRKDLRSWLSVAERYFAQLGMSPGSRARSGARYRAGEAPDAWSSGMSGPRSRRATDEPARRRSSATARIRSRSAARCCGSSRGPASGRSSSPSATTPRTGGRSAHGPGKTATAARVALWFLSVFPHAGWSRPRRRPRSCATCLWREIAAGAP